MADPLSVSALSDLLDIASVVWDEQRNDEMSGSGDGRTWAAKLAPELWTAEIDLNPAYHADAKRIAAIIRKLEGPRNTFMLVDPLSKYPAADPNGTILGSATVTVDTIATDRDALTLTGLPAGYVITTGDKGQINYSADPGRTYYFEVSSDATADGAGDAAFDVHPHAPLLVAAGASVILKKPACKGFIVPGSFRPGRATGMITQDAGFRFMERR